MHGTVALPAARVRRPTPASPLILRLALRELRSGLRGFGIFLACIALGVAAIAGVSSLSRSLTEGIGREGRRILGGDMAFSPAPAGGQRRRSGPSCPPKARSARSRPCAPWRSPARRARPWWRSKAVDGAYPAVGTLETDPPLPPADLLAQRERRVRGRRRPGRCSARLDLKVGDRVTIGDATVELRASLTSEPDKIASGIGFGPRLLVSQEALRATGPRAARQPRALDLPRHAARRLSPTDAGLLQVEAEAARALPEAGWSIRTRVNAGSAISSAISSASPSS